MLKGLHNHWTKKGGRLMPKKAFNTQKEAEEYMFINGIKKSVYNAYKCDDCGMYHIGHKLKK